MSYEKALEAAGFTVHEIKYFGAYQGEWCAKVTDPDGVAGFVHDWYGSCTVCDSFQADVDMWEPWSGDEDYEEEMARYKEKVKQFGTRYYGTVMSGDTLTEFLSSLDEDDWSDEKTEMAQWVRERL